MREKVLSFFGEPLFIATDSPLLTEVLAGCLNMVLPDDSVSTRPKAGIALTVEAPLDDILSERLPVYLKEAVDQLAQVLNYRFLFLHACAFSRDHDCIVFSGPSGSGKTTLSMLAHHLGYDVLGEDIIALEWETGHVFPVLFPFRPRPFTRNLIHSWFGDASQRNNTHGKTGSKPVHEKRPMGRLYLSGEDPAIITGLVRSVFGHDKLPLHTIMAQVTRATAQCRVRRCPTVYINPDKDKKKAIEAFNTWIKSESADFPEMIFNSRS